MRNKQEKEVEKQETSFLLRYQRFFSNRYYCIRTFHEYVLLYPRFSFKYILPKLGSIPSNTPRYRIELYDINLFYKCKLYKKWNSYIFYEVEKSKFRLFQLACQTWWVCLCHISASLAIGKIKSECKKLAISFFK